MALFRRLHQSLDRIDATIDRNTRAFEDLVVIIREDRIRGERSLQSFERSLQSFERSIARNTAALDDLRAESRAHTQAILRLLDRWGNGPAPAT